MPDNDVDSNSLTESKSRADRLAEQFLEDRARRAGRPQPRIGGCFLCGRSYSLSPLDGDNSTRFCCDKHRQAYDDGAMPERDINPFAPGPWHHIAGPPAGYMPKGMRMGRHGFFVDCLHCKREFESKGPRCCSIECERAYQGRANAAAVVAEVGGALADKRKCECCGGPIPNWTGEGVKRRRTPKSRRYCSDRCSAKARKTGHFFASPASETGFGPPEVIQPIFGPSTPPLNLVGGYHFPDAPTKESPTCRNW